MDIECEEAFSGGGMGKPGTAEPEGLKETYEAPIAPPSVNQMVQTPHFTPQSSWQTCWGDEPVAFWLPS